MENVFVDLLLHKGLYDKCEIDETNVEQWAALVGGKIKIDVFCPDCGVNRIFSLKPLNICGLINGRYLSLSLEQHILQNIEKRNLDYNARDKAFAWRDESFSEYVRIINLQFQCTMDMEHSLDYVLLTDSKSVMKIGQYPSIADLQFSDLEQYKKVLAKSDMRELKRAVGLYSQNIGVGAFVYLRRIVENLINQVIQDAIIENEFTENDFKGLKVHEKIKKLKNHLPAFLTDNSSIYGILSKGIHELSENECLEYFLVIEKSILLILQQREEERKKKETIRDLEKSLQKISMTIKS